MAGLKSLMAMFLGTALLMGWDLVTQAQDQAPKGDEMDADVTQGALRVKQKDGKVVECPLRHTDVKADISGFIARVKVTQTFFNPFDEKIEAVYVFPLPHLAAVDDMTMVIGDRRIIGVIKRREEARQIYEQALAQGLTASLLEQERPNIFTQSVGNIKPKQEVRIEISYVDVLKYDMGVYEFHYPMVVGPRYIPGSPTPTASAGGWAPNTDRVPDASRITPPVLKPGFRTGHDISLALTLDAGVPVQDLKVESHQAEITRDGKTKAAAKLSPADSIPNKDFILTYRVVGEKPEMAVLTHRTQGAGYFMLMVQPRIDEQLKTAPPREVCFLIDVSGSMSGQPTAKVQDAMRKFFELAKPDDRVQVITFESQTQKLFDRPVPATGDNVNKALNFANAIRGGGGTEMLKGIQAVLNEPADPQRVRIVILLTDGYIGNEAEIIAEVGKRCGDSIRFWTIGIGSSPNRFLLDGVAKQGGGMSGTLELNEDPTKLVREIVERIHRAQLADIRINWGGLPVYETYPVKVPELWAGRPVILFGRYEEGGKARITISGKAEGKPLSYSLDVDFPNQDPAHEVLTKVWARNKIEDLMSMAYYADSPPVVEEVTEIALAYKLMSQYTSFVAVDESERGKIKEPVRRPVRMMVPVPMPEGVSYEGVFGGEADADDEKFERKADKGGVFFGRGGFAAKSKAPMAPPPMVTPSVPAAVPVGGKPSPRPMGPPAEAAPMVKQQVSRTQTPALKAEPMVERELRESSDASTGAAMPNTMAQSAQKRREEARKALTEAQELKKKGDLEAAIAKYQLAFLLEKAFLAANPWSDDGTSGTITNELNETLDALTESRAKSVPALAKTLDLVIRRQDVAEALDQVATAAGIEIAVVPGSIEDVSDLVLTPPRVVYLDLRGATAAQAIQWIVEPCHMAWTVNNGKVTVGSSRRLPGVSAWAYRVGDVALPTREEFGKNRKKMAAVNERLWNEFLAGVETVDKSAVLIGGSSVLVYGEPAVHEKMEALLKALRDPNAALPVEETEALAKLRKATAARYASRQGATAKRAAAAQTQRLAAMLNENSWKLLADAAAGKLDLETLTRLQEALDGKGIGETAKAQPALVYRSIWAITEAAKSLPKESELQGLATMARKVCDENLEAMAQAARPNVATPQGFVPILYAALVTGDGKLKEAVTAPAAGAAQQAIAQALLGSVDAEGLAKQMAEGRVQGEDLVALEALAAKKAGGRAWETFREGARDLLGGQPISGNVTLLVSRLSSPTCALRAVQAAGG